jgi:hypothetical protein
MCKKVCNYKNYATFTIALYFGGTREGVDLANEYVERAKESVSAGNYDKDIWNPNQALLYILEDILKDNFWTSRDFNYDLDSQMMKVGFNEVDWRELAEDILNE